MYHRVFNFSRWKLVKLLSFLFLSTQIQCLHKHKILENGSRSRNIWRITRVFLPYCRGQIYWYHRAFGYFWVFIGWYMLISIFKYSNLVSWSTQNIRRMALDPEVGTITTNFSHILECVHCRSIEPLVFFWVFICRATLLSISGYSYSVYWWTQNSRKLALSSKILRTTKHLVNECPLPDLHEKCLGL